MLVSSFFIFLNRSKTYNFGIDYVKNYNFDVDIKTSKWPFENPYF